MGEARQSEGVGEKEGFMILETSQKFSEALEQSKYLLFLVYKQIKPQVC